MKRALELAQKGEGRTRPNPLVGAVVVRNGRRISEGYHSYFGGPHAEVVALRKAGLKAKGATLYVTLEPCSSWGKTPPCVDLVIASGIRRAVVGSLDPNPQNHRHGIQKLKSAGIRVETGILQQEVQQQNEVFFKVMKIGLPFVTLKMAQSLDGKIATYTGKSRWISSPESRRWVHELRSCSDAVLVGKNTAFQDNPRLQGTGKSEKPWRIILDPDSRLSPKSRIFMGTQPTLLAISEKKLNGIHRNSRQENKILILVPERQGKLDLRLLLKKIVDLGVHHLLVEGGGEVAWSLLSEGLVDRLIWIVAPKIVGGRSAKTSVEGEGVKKMERALPLSWEKIYPLGADWIFEARPRGKS